MADTASNVILFLTLFLVGIILATWYIGTVRPVRYAIGAIQQDVAGLNQHVTNACTFTVYNASYFAASNGFLEINTTHLCIYSPEYGDCHVLSCPVGSTRLTLIPRAKVHVEKSAGSVTISLDS
jgi:hypothetical protein